MYMQLKERYKYSIAFTRSLVYMLSKYTIIAPQKSRIFCYISEAGQDTKVRLTHAQQSKSHPYLHCLPGFLIEREGTGRFPSCCYNYITASDTL